MTVKEVIAELQKLPEDMLVMVPAHEVEADYSVAYSVQKRMIVFDDGHAECAVIDEK